MHSHIILVVVIIDALKNKKLIATGYEEYVKIRIDFIL